MWLLWHLLWLCLLLLLLVLLLLCWLLLLLLLPLRLLCQRLHLLLLLLLKHLPLRLLHLLHLLQLPLLDLQLLGQVCQLCGVLRLQHLLRNPSRQALRLGLRLHPLPLVLLQPLLIHPLPHLLRELGVLVLELPVLGGCLCEGFALCPTHPALWTGLGGHAEEAACCTGRDKRKHVRKQGTQMRLTGEDMNM